LLEAIAKSLLSALNRLRGRVNALAGELLMSDVRNLMPQDVAKGIAEGRMLLVDVREPNEIAVESYPDALVVPLSSFDPADIPDPQGKEVVFACRSGKRSVTASLAAQNRGFAYDAHLAGGIIAWKEAGLPTKVPG
jgi:rhodanese-related sulfurtransferase